MRPLDAIRAVLRRLADAWRLPVPGARRAGAASAHRALAVIPASFMAVAGGLLGDGEVLFFALAWYGGAAALAVPVGAGTASLLAGFARRDSPRRLRLQGMLLGAAMPMVLIGVIAPAVAPSDAGEFTLACAAIVGASAVAGLAAGRELGRLAATGPREP